MPVVVEQIFEGMPDPVQLRRVDVDGQVMIMVGDRLVFAYDAADTGMRNLAVVTLTQLRFAGKDVAAVMGLTPVYVSMLRGRARHEGSAGLVRDRGRPAKLTTAQITRARAWRDEDVSDVVIGARLNVADTTVARALRDHPAPAAQPTTADTLDLDLDPQPELESESQPEPVRQSASDRRETRPERLGHQTPCRATRQGRHLDHRPGRAGGRVHHRGTLRPDQDPPAGPGRTAGRDRARREDHARVRPGRRLPQRVHRLP